MNKQAVIDIVKNIFMHYGYSVSSSDTFDLVAEKGPEHLVINFEKSPNLNSVKHFSNKAQSYKGKGILISGSFDEKTRMFALDEGLTLWDRGQLESHIGRVILSSAFSDYEKKAPVMEAIDLASIQKTSSQEPVKNERTIKVLLRSVPINIGKSDALRIAEAKVGSAKNQTLKFIPVWYYSYSFSMQKKFKSKLVDLSGEGDGYIHAVSGDNSFIKFKDIQENIMMPTQNYEIRQPAVEKKDAAVKALNSIVREHTKEIRINEMIGDTIVFENKMFSPDPDKITLKMDLLHIPVWEIKGKREAIEINGYDGHIMVVKLYNDAEMV